MLQTKAQVPLAQAAWVQIPKVSFPIELPTACLAPCNAFILPATQSFPVQTFIGRSCWLVMPMRITGREASVRDKMLLYIGFDLMRACALLTCMAVSNHIDSLAEWSKALASGASP